MAEDIFKDKFQLYNKSGELYDIRYFLDYQSFCTELSTMNIEKLSDTFANITKVILGRRSSPFLCIVMHKLAPEQRGIFQEFYNDNKKIFAHMVCESAVRKGLSLNDFNMKMISQSNVIVEINNEFNIQHMYDPEGFVIKDTFFTKMYDKYENKLDDIIKIFYVKVSIKKEKKARYMAGIIREVYRYWGDMTIKSESYERDQKNNQNKHHYQYNLIPNEKNESLVAAYESGVLENVYKIMYCM
jgi:hypothetical protein